MVLTEGWDLPEVGCCILARPTKKMGLYRQMIGRVLRPAEGKPDAIILDHSGAVFRHGFVEDRVHWTLDPDRRAESPAHQQRCTEHSSRLLECTQCGAIRIAGEACFHCGFLPQRPPRAVVIRGRRSRARQRIATRQRRVYDSERAQPLARDVDPYRRGARLQSRLGRAQVQRKIRRVSRLGRFA